MLDRLQRQLLAHIGNLHGEWVQKSSAYELELCNLLEMEHAPRKTYWDAVWGEYLLEFKKGHRHFWFNLVRYSNLILESDVAASRVVYTLFFIADKQRHRIDEVVLVETHALLTLLRIDPEIARSLIDLRTNMLRGLNAQCRLTVSDIRSISTFTVKLTDCTQI